MGYTPHIARHMSHITRHTPHALIREKKRKSIKKKRRASIFNNPQSEVVAIDVWEWASGASADAPGIGLEIVSGLT